MRLSGEEENCYKADPLNLEKDHKEAFRLIDKNGSGDINFVEFVDWMKTHVPEKMQPQELLEHQRSLAKALVEMFSHIEMAEEGYIKESDQHILQRVIDETAEQVVKLKTAMREKSVGSSKPQWTEPPTGLSVERLKRAHMEYAPLNMSRVSTISWEVLCLPLPGEYDDPQQRVWIAEILRRVSFKNGKETVEAPSYYNYDRKTFSWQLPKEGDKLFEVTFADIGPGIGLFCLLKTAANFGTKIRWSETKNAIEGAIDMKFMKETQGDKFFKRMRGVALDGLIREGFIEQDQKNSESADRAAEEWLVKSLVVRPRVVMATLSELGIVEINPEWQDFDALGED